MNDFIVNKAGTTDRSRIQQMLYRESTKMVNKIVFNKTFSREPYTPELQTLLYNLKYLQHTSSDLLYMLHESQKP